MSKITTQSTSKVTSEVSPIILRETKTTRLIFSPMWVETSSNPLRGGFRFQRKGIKDTWEDVDHKPLSSLKKDEGYELNLTGDDMSILFAGLEEIKALLTKYGHSYGVRSFDLSKDNAESILLQIGKIENRNWVIEQLRKLESESFENIGSIIGLAKLENIIEIFENNLSNDNEKFWQSFFESNTWVLQQIFAQPVIYLQGETYVGGKSTSGRQGQGGSATDFLLKDVSSGSFAVIEIKTPDKSIVGKCYRGCEIEAENTTHEMSGELSGGIVQLQNQIHQAVSGFYAHIKRDFDDLDMLNPKGILLIGNKNNLTVAEKKSFNLFRKSNSDIEIHTFDELLEKIKNLRDLYGDK